MSITSVTSSLLGISQVDSSSSATDSSTTIGQEDFLTLLLTQLQNQNPLDPMDPDTMVSQLCSLSQLEQAETTNSYLEDLSLYASSLNNTQTLGLIGKTVATSGNEVSIKDGSADSLGFELSGDAAAVNITIYDESGQEIKSIELGEISAGKNSQTWDGTDNDGNLLSDGTYTFEVAAYDSNGDSVEATTYAMSKVTGVYYNDNIAYLTTNDGEIAYGDVAWVS